MLCYEKYAWCKERRGGDSSTISSKAFSFDRCLPLQENYPIISARTSVKRKQRKEEEKKNLFFFVTLSSHKKWRQSYEESQ